MYKIFHYGMEIIGWIRIVACPFLIALSVAALIYFTNPTTATMIVGGIILFTGLVIGIIWANRIWKTKGTIRFISSISATPELDHNPETNINSTNQ